VIALACIPGIAFLPAGSDFGAVLVLVLLLDIVVLIVLRAWIRARNAASLPERPERSFRFVATVTLLWAAVDAFVVGLGAISVFLCMAGVFYFLPRALAARRNVARLKLRLSKAAITSILGFAALGIIGQGNVIARERAEKLIIAVDQYRMTNGRYPKRLEELVPAFIPEVPMAKYVVIADKFGYSASDKNHSLTYMSTPPFGWRIFNFEKHKWNALLLD